MKNFLGIMTLVMAANLICVSQAEARRVDNRQNRQNGRIQQGAGSGSLTWREQRNLQHDQNRIARREARFQADGNYTLGEKYRIEKAQDRESKEIYRKKHNDRHY